MRFFSLTLFLLTAATTLAQAPVLPAFEVASVRPSKPGSAGRSNIPLDAGFVYGSLSAEDARAVAGGSLVVIHQSLWRYISFAYKLSGTQELAMRFNFFSGTPKSGAPLWVTGSFDSAADPYDILARAPANTPIDQMRLMMQSLLAERFHLVVHYETADAPVFALTLVKAGVTGAHLQPHPATDLCAAPTPELPPPTSPVGELPPACGVIAHVPSAAPGQHFGGRAVGMPLLATTIPTMTGLAAMPRPVVDETGLTGLYDFTLTWLHDPSGEEATADNASNFRDALKSQLGLQIKNSHAAMPFLIVDHVERPSEN